MFFSNNIQNNNQKYQSFVKIGSVLHANMYSYIYENM